MGLGIMFGVFCVYLFFIIILLRKYYYFFKIIDEKWKFYMMKIYK